MNKSKHQEQQLNEEINDKLNELWSGMKNKRKQLMKNLTPSYSRRTNQSEIQNNLNYSESQNQIIKIRQKLTYQVSERKKKEIQIQKLRETIIQLTNDKKMLILQLERSQNQSAVLNQSSIHSVQKRQNDGKTANFSSNKKRQKNNKNIATIQEEPQQNHHEIEQNQEIDQQMSKQRLLQLLRSTAQYRQFVFYYDSHQLSYLKKLQQSHKRNCDHSKVQRQKQYWAPTEIINQFKAINRKENLQLSDNQIQYIISRMKFYYERNTEQRLKKIKQNYQNKARKIHRQNQHGIPYDILQICKAKQRQLSNYTKKPRATTTK